MTGQSLGGERRMTGNAAVCQESVHFTPTQSGVSLPAQNTTQILLAPRRQLQTRNHCHSHAHPCEYKQYTDFRATICLRSAHTSHIKTTLSPAQTQRLAYSACLLLSNLHQCLSQLVFTWNASMRGISILKLSITESLETWIVFLQIVCRCIVAGTFLPSVSPL